MFSIGLMEVHVDDNKLRSTYAARTRDTLARW